MTRVFLVDDHDVVRRGLAGILESQPDFVLVGEASTCREATTGIAMTLPDVAVLDVRLPDGSGIDLCRHIRQQHPSVQCLILSAFDDDDAVLAAVMANAAGFLLKTARIPELVGALRAVAHGHTLLDSPIARSAMRQLRTAPAEDPRFGSLSLRERQILALIANALTNREIGDRLGLAEKTVKNYVSTLLTKLGFEHRTQAAVFELERGRGAR